MNTDPDTLKTTNQNLVHIHNELVELQHTLRCPLCQYTMQSPAILPCLHSFCHSCIVHYCQHSSSSSSSSSNNHSKHKDKKKMECPLCKDPFSSKRSIRKSSALQNIVNCVKGTIKAFGLAPFEYEENYLEMTQLHPASIDGNGNGNGNGDENVEDESGVTPRLKRSRLSKCHEHLTVSRAMQYALANHPHNQHNNPNDSKDCDKKEDCLELRNNVTSNDAQEVFETKKKMSRSSDHTTTANKKRRMFATNSVSSKAVDDYLQEQQQKQQHQQKRNKYDRIVKEMDKVIQCDEKALVKAAVMIRRKSLEGGNSNHHRCLSSITSKSAAAEKDVTVEADVFHDASSEEIATIIDGTIHSIEDRMGTGDVSNGHSWNTKSEERYPPKKKQDTYQTNNNNDSNNRSSKQDIIVTENFKESNTRYDNQHQKENVITDTKYSSNNNITDIHQSDNDTEEVFLTSSSQDNDDEVEDDRNPKPNQNLFLRENADYLSTFGPEQNLNNSPNIKYPTTIPNTVHHPTSSRSTTTTVKNPPPQPSMLSAAPSSAITSQPHIPPRTIVHITSRTWPGSNKPGGVARIVSYCTHSDTYNVSYVLGGKEKCVPSQYVKVMTAADATTDEDGREQRKQRRGRVIARALQDARNKENVHNNITRKKRRSTVIKKNNKEEQEKKKRKVVVKGISKNQALASKETLRREATNRLEEKPSNNTMSKSKLRKVKQNANPTSAIANSTTTALMRYNQRFTKHRSRIEIISSGLSHEESDVLTKFVQKYNSKHKQCKISIATSFDLEKTTMCFASILGNEDAIMARKRSFKAMRCMLAGVAILHVGYLRDCSMNNTYDFVEIQRKHCVDTLQTKCQDFLSIAKGGILRVAAAQVHESDIKACSILNRCLVLACGTWNKIDGSPKLSDVKQLLLDCRGKCVNDSRAFLRKVSSERKRSCYDRYLILCDESPELRLDDLGRILKVLQGSVVNTVCSSFLFDSISSGMLLDANMFPPKSANMLF